ncbi:ankyrin repeat domain-containing protein [Flavobacterium sp. WV_118_3]|uniref:ankyrin repeat domain-containing protein n=1 Tax=Flavobacterium sp. WV_118_3 TaxID=3151764 RepID=UPI002B9392A2|nr:ankyrin repeat domain-containing protein [Flavobacterium sp.]
MIFSIIIKNQLNELIDVLKNENIDLNQRNEFGNTPLHVACNSIYAINKEIVEVLLKHPLDINARGIDDCTPLYYAIGKGDNEVVQILIDNGADVNIPDSYGNTPLMTAADMFDDDATIIQLLLENGADPHQKNNYGVSVYKLLEMPGNASIRNLFPPEN